MNNKDLTHPTVYFINALAQGLNGAIVVRW